jgi:hypothetical protein
VNIPGISAVSSVAPIDRTRFAGRRLAKIRAKAGDADPAAAGDTAITAASVLSGGPSVSTMA